MKQFFEKIKEFFLRTIYGIPYWAIGLVPLIFVVVLIVYLFKPKKKYK